MQAHRTPRRPYTTLSTLRHHSPPSPPDLESSFLISAILILVLGCIFESKGFSTHSYGYLILTGVTAVVIVGSALVFFVLLAFELYRSLTFSVLNDVAREVELTRVEQAFSLRSTPSRTLSRLTPSSRSSSARAMAQFTGARRRGSRIASEPGVEAGARGGDHIPGGMDPQAGMDATASGSLRDDLSGTGSPTLPVDPVAPGAGPGQGTPHPLALPSLWPGPDPDPQGVWGGQPEGVGTVPTGITGMPSPRAPRQGRRAVPGLGVQVSPSAQPLVLAAPWSPWSSSKASTRAMSPRHPGKAGGPADPFGEEDVAHVVVNPLRSPGPVRCSGAVGAGADSPGAGVGVGGT